MIINLTQHPSTPEQRAAGVVDLEGDWLDQAKALLTFEELPTTGEVRHTAWRLAQLVDDWCSDQGITFEDDKREWPAVMIGGAPFLMGPLEDAIQQDFHLRVVYAFSRRQSVEEAQPDGTVRKAAIFHHVGFVEALQWP